MTKEQRERLDAAILTQLQEIIALQWEIELSRLLRALSADEGKRRGLKR
jgi:hypothetical protein